MRYLTLAEALVIAEIVTEIDTAVLARADGIELLDSALHAPQASYADHEFYPDFADKAAVLCALNGRSLRVLADNAVDQMLAVAAGERTETDMAVWISARLDPANSLDVANGRLQDIVTSVRLLASDADTQNAWLHPCGRTREEPLIHNRVHQSCAPIAELVSYFGDMWPAWRPIVIGVLPAGAEPALDRLDRTLHRLDGAAYVDEINTLGEEPWQWVRQVAADVLRLMSSETSGT